MLKWRGICEYVSDLEEVARNSVTGQNHRPGHLIIGEIFDHIFIEPVKQYKLRPIQKDFSRQLFIFFAKLELKSSLSKSKS